MSGTHWVAGWNIPGCLPETGPVEFDTPEGAHEYLRDVVREFWWQDTDAMGAIPAQRRWAFVADALDDIEDADMFGATCPDGHLAFWVRAEGH